MGVTFLDDVTIDALEAVDYSANATPYKSIEPIMINDDTSNDDMIMLGDILTPLEDGLTSIDDVSMFSYI